MPHPIKTASWTADHSLQASQEGWSISECSAEYQLQRDNDSEIFLTDNAAAVYVKRRAALGNELARQAFAKLVSCSSDDVALFAPA